MEKKFVKHGTGDDIQEFLMWKSIYNKHFSRIAHTGVFFLWFGTKVDKKLDEDGNPQHWSRPKNSVDEISMKYNLLMIVTA